MARRMYLISEDQLRALTATKGQATIVNAENADGADHGMDHILHNPNISSREKIFALADADERLRNIIQKSQPALPPVPTNSVPSNHTSYLVRRMDTIINAVGKSQKNNAERLVRYLHEIYMDVNESMEPIIGDVVVSGANISELVHWVTNPVDNAYRPRELETFMRLLSQHHMPATMVANKNRRLMYTALQQAESSDTQTTWSRVRKPSELMKENSDAFRTANSSPEVMSAQSGSGARWSFY